MTGPLDGGVNLRPVTSLRNKLKQDKALGANEDSFGGWCGWPHVGRLRAVGRYHWGELLAARTRQLLNLMSSLDWIRDC